MKKKKRAMDEATEMMMKEKQQLINKLIEEYGSISINSLMERLAKYESDETSRYKLLQERDNEIMEQSKIIEKLNQVIITLQHASDEN